MRILFRKISGEQHGLTVVRPDGRRESLVCETRSVLMHDFIHYAVESAARIESGFWGLLARATPAGAAVELDWPPDARPHLQSARRAPDSPDSRAGRPRRDRRTTAKVDSVRRN